MTDEQWEILKDAKGVCHNFGSSDCWCKPTLTSDETHLIFTHHYSPEALELVKRAYPGQAEYGVVRIPKDLVSMALATANKMSALCDSTLVEH